MTSTIEIPTMGVIWSVAGLTSASTAFYFRKIALAFICRNGLAVFLTSFLGLIGSLIGFGIYSTVTDDANMNKVLVTVPKEWQDICAKANSISDKGVAVAYILNLKSSLPTLPPEQFAAVNRKLHNTSSSEYWRAALDISLARFLDVNAVK